MIKKVLNNIKKYNLIEFGERVAVGVSGGADSICLLHVLSYIATSYKFKIFAIHINHMLRGSESDGDMAYVREVCDKWGIELVTRSINVKEIAAIKKVSLEEAARDVRYNEFTNIATHVGAPKIAVAHNKNDQAETVLLNIIRGTGLDGLKGMECKNGQIIRPLLNIKRNEIEEYCKINNLNPRIDSSNLESIYSRNKVRLDVIPLIDQLFKTDIVDSVYKMSTLVRDDCDIINEKICELYKGCTVGIDKNEVRIDIAALNQYSEPCAKRILRNAIKVLKGNLIGIENIHIENILTLCYYGKTGSVVCLPKGLRATKSYGILMLNYKVEGVVDNEVYFEEKLNIPGSTQIDVMGYVFKADTIEKDSNCGNMNSYRSNDSSYMQYFDLEKLVGTIFVRNRRAGDVFKPLGCYGTKKLKEYLIDEKILREVRKNIPLVAMGNEIIWVAGYKISDKFKVTKDTKRILRLEFVIPRS